MTNRHRFYRYLASGGVSTAAHYLTLYALVQMGTEPVLGSTIAALVGLVLNYSVSRRWRLKLIRTKTPVAVTCATR